MNKNLIIATVSGVAVGSIALNIWYDQQNLELIRKVKLSNLIVKNWQEMVVRVFNTMPPEQALSLMNEMNKEIKFMEIMINEHID
ncbi:MAG TPA: hypothetical protein PKW49_00900 [Paludibacteraceae bacterium]|nr:hypothetical protein [Paludibacteraceae bacterium]